MKLVESLALFAGYISFKDPVGEARTELENLVDRGTKCAVHGLSAYLYGVASARRGELSACRIAEPGKRFREVLFQFSGDRSGANPRPERVDDLLGPIALQPRPGSDEHRGVVSELDLELGAKPETILVLVALSGTSIAL